MKDREKFLKTPGTLPWRLKPTRDRNPLAAVVYDADGRLVTACAIGNAELIVKAANATMEAA